MKLKQPLMQALLITLGVASTPLVSAMETNPEKTPSKSWFETLKARCTPNSNKQTVKQDVMVEDLWKITIPHTIEHGLDLKSFANICLLNTKFHLWAIELVTHLELSSQAQITPYRSMTYLGYLLWQKIPARFPNLQSLSIDLSLPGNHDDSELGKKLSQPDDYLDLENTRSFYSVDARLNSLALVESAQRSMIPKEVTDGTAGNYENWSARNIIGAISMLGAEAYKVNRIKSILDLPAEKDTPLIEVPNPHRTLIKTYMLDYLKGMPNLTSLRIVSNWYFNDQLFANSFLQNLPKLHHLEFVSPKRGDGGCMKMDNLHTFDNLLSLTTLNLCSNNQIKSFEGWEAFKYLSSLTVCLDGSAFGHSKKMEESLVTHLPNLRSLHLIHANGDVFPRILNLVHLNTLGFIDSAINDDDLAEVSKMMNLTTLRLIRITPFKAYNDHCQSRDKYSEAALGNLQEQRQDLTIVVLNK